MDTSAQVFTAALIGGTISKLSGGWFANGAVTGAFSHAFNQLLHPGPGSKNLTTSADGVEFIKRFEGFESSPYQVPDANGKPSGNYTVGYGHEISFSDVISGQYNNITQQQADALLALDVAIAEQRVQRFIANNNSSITLLQHEFDALVSLSLNSGYIGRFPDLSKEFNAANHSAIAKEFLDITNRGLSGLVVRRQAELNLYLNANYSGSP